VHLHNLWGVGSNTDCGGTGLLVSYPSSIGHSTYQKARRWTHR
jgi:hypothetical protein